MIFGSLLVLAIQSGSVSAAVPIEPKTLVRKASAELADQPADALRDAEHAIRLDPMVPDGNRLRGEALEALGRSREAAAALQAALQQQPLDAEASIHLARIEAASGDTHAALVRLAPLVEHGEARNNARFERAMIFTRAKRTKEAITDYQALIASAPTAAAYYNLGWLQADGDDNEQALANFQQALQLDPHDVDTLTSLGTIYIRLDRNQDALAAYDAALALDHGSHAALTGKANGLYNLKDWARAVEAYRAAERVQADDASLVISEAEALSAAGDKVAARTTYDRALRIDPKSVDALSGRAVLLRAADHNELALVDLTRAITLSPDRADLRIDRAWALRALNRPKQARVDVDTAIRLDPKNTGAYNILGLIHTDAGNYQAALDAYNKGLTIDPKHDAILFNRADAFIGLKQYDRALRDIKEYLRIVPDDADAYLARGKTYWLIDDDVRAVEELDYAIHLSPKLARAYWYRSQAKSDIGDKAGANADRTEALRLDPSLAN